MVSPHSDPVMWKNSSGLHLASSLGQPGFTGEAFQLWFCVREYGQLSRWSSRMFALPPPIPPAQLALRTVGARGGMGTWLVAAHIIGSTKPNLFLFQALGSCVPQASELCVGAVLHPRPLHTSAWNVPQLTSVSTPLQRATWLLPTLHLSRILPPSSLLVLSLR